METPRSNAGPTRRPRSRHDFASSPFQPVALARLGRFALRLAEAFAANNRPGDFATPTTVRPWLSLWGPRLVPIRVTVERASIGPHPTRRIAARR